MLLIDTSRYRHSDATSDGCFCDSIADSRGPTNDEDMLACKFNVHVNARRRFAEINGHCSCHRCQTFEVAHDIRATQVQTELEVESRDRHSPPRKLWECSIYGIRLHLCLLPTALIFIQRSSVVLYASELHDSTSSIYPYKSALVHY
jgi:hypothetical protein